MSTMARQTLEMTCYYALTGSVVLFKPTANAVTHNNASQPEHHTRSSVHMSDCKAHKRLYNRKQCAQSIPCVCVCVTLASNIHGAKHWAHSGLPHAHALQQLTIIISYDSYTSFPLIFAAGTSWVGTIVLNHSGLSCRLISTVS